MLITHLTALVIPAAYHSAKSHLGGVDNSTFVSAWGSDASSWTRDISQWGMEMVSDGSDLEIIYADGLKFISRGTAILLLGVYIAYLFFQVRYFSVASVENSGHTDTLVTCSLLF